MLWFYNSKLNDNNVINFHQIFIENNLVYSDDKLNFIYSFDSYNFDKSTSDLNLNNYVVENITCEIKIIDNIISYVINNVNYVFLIKSNFIKHDENKFNLPIFSYTYKLTSSKRLPNLIESKYDNTLNLNFKIYKLDDENKIQFIIETNSITNVIRKYFITTDLNLIQPFITQISLSKNY